MERITRIIVLCLFALSLSSNAAAQVRTDLEFIVNPFAASPSYAGYNGNHELFANTQYQFTGIEGAPVQAWVDYNGIVKGNIGIGAKILFEQAGAFRNLRADIAYAYHLHLGAQHRISIGIQGSLNQTRIDFTDNNGDANDPLLLANGSKSGVAFNAGVGVNYAFKGLNISAAMPTILKNGISKLTLYNQAPALRYFVSYDIKLHRNWYLKPSALVSQPLSSPIVFVAAATVTYKQCIWLNLAYQHQNIFAAGVGGVISNRVMVQYAYKFSTSGIAKSSFGSHELTLGIAIGKKKPNTMNSSIFKERPQAPYYEWE